MRIDEYLTDEGVLLELGERIERMRLERNLTQRELAVLAGVSRTAVQRAETGESVTLTSFVRVLRALGLLDVLEQLIPEPTPSPVELLKLRGHMRRRASGERHAQRRAGSQGGADQWGAGRQRSTSGRRGAEAQPGPEGQPGTGGQPGPGGRPGEEAAGWRWGDEESDGES